MEAENWSLALTQPGFSRFLSYERRFTDRNILLQSTFVNFKLEICDKYVFDNMHLKYSPPLVLFLHTHTHMHTPMDLMCVTNGLFLLYHHHLLLPLLLPILLLLFFFLFLFLKCTSYKLKSPVNCVDIEFAPNRMFWISMSSRKRI